MTTSSHTFRSDPSAHPVNIWTLKTWILIGLIIALLVPAAVADTPPNGERFYQLIFVYVKDAAKYHRYAEKLGPVVTRYGGQADRILLPDTVFPESLGQPDFVNLVSYNSEEAYRAFENDPDFQALKALRAEAIDFKGVSLRPTAMGHGARRLASRHYMLEMVQFRNDDPKPFERYRNAAKPVMSRHGFHTEWRFQPVETIGAFELPDAVAIHFFDSVDGKAAAEKDPKHPEIETLYSEAIEGLVWIEGRALTK